MKTEPARRIISASRQDHAITSPQGGKRGCALMLWCFWLLCTAALGAEVESPRQSPFQSRQIEYQLPEQPLAHALTAYAERSGLQLLYRSRILPDLMAPALNGYFSPKEALQRLLRGTGLVYTYGGQGVVVLHPSEPAAPGEPQGSPPAIEETYVTGIRSTLKLSLALKQASATLVDLITSEDIGKFPDKNVADALQRIAGVSVDRLWGEGRDVNIRGTHKDINRTLLNGQHVASAYWWANDNLSRGFNYSTLASQLVQSLEVHKSASADMDEGSIGGTVVVRTRRPFALRPYETHVSYEQHYSELAGAWAPQASVLTSWKNPRQTFGVLVAFNRQTQRRRRDGLETFPDNNLYRVTDAQGATTGDVYSIWGGGTAILQQDRLHNTGNLTLQWAPSDAWNLVLNLLRSDMDIDNINHNFLFVPGGYKLREQPPARVANPQYAMADDGHRVLIGGTLLNAGSTGAVLDSIYRQAYIDTGVNDLDITYAPGQWQVHVQLGTTDAVGGTDHDYLYRFLGDTRTRFALDANAIEVDYLDIDPRRAADMSTFSSESRDWIRRMENSEAYGQIDVTLPVDRGFISAWKIGSKYRDYRIENHRVIGTIDENHAAWPQLRATGLEQVSLGVTPRLNRQVATSRSLMSYAWTDGARLRAVIHPYYAQGVMHYRYDPSAFYVIDENVLAHYLKAEFEQGQWRGDAGVRVVSTDQTGRAFRGQQLVSVSNDYRDWLPSLNISYELAPDIVLRGAAARVMARPGFQHLSPGIIVDPTSGSGAAGNPHLEPYRANQLDLGIEWYFADASLLSAALFRKDLSTFVYPETSLETVNGEPLYLTRPRNLPGADIQGLELQWQQDFGNGFGLLANYTYTDATVPSPDAVRTLELPGNSRGQFNASVYYEGRRFSGRLSYNYRSRSFGELIAGSQTETAAYQQWDATLQWRLNSKLSLSLEGVNLNNEVIYIRTASNVPQGFYENGRRLMVGVQFDF